MTWMLVWQMVLVLGLSAFVGVVAVVTYRGFGELRDLFEQLGGD